MIARKAIIGLSLLCAIALFAVGAASASAKGTTLFTCVPAVLKKAGFNDAHCKEALGEGAKFEQSPINAKEKTELIGKSLNTEGKTLAFVGQYVDAGVTVEITCSGIETKTTAATNEELGGIMQNVGTGVSFTFPGCTVTSTAKTEGCKVKEGKMELSNLKSSTFEGGGFEMGIKFEPVTPPKLGNLIIESCKNAALNGSLPFEGSIAGLTEGVTLNVTKATTENTLTFNGVKAFLEFSLTTRRAPLAGVEQKPVFPITTEP